MPAAALEAEAASFVEQFADERPPDGRRRVVRHGTGPERAIQTGIGPIPARRRKVREGATGAPAEQEIRFTSNILPRWARRSRRLDALLPVLCLRGNSTGGFSGSPDSAARGGRPEPLAGGDRTPHGWLAGGV
ncbi:MAG: hypothetical protein Kow0058_10030 [Roseovarius sp.]